MTEDELMHHGIKKQKWGEKNGPPYPLDRETHNRVVSGGGKTVASSKKDSDKEKAKILRAQARAKRRSAKAVIKATKAKKRADEKLKKAEEDRAKQEKEAAEARAKRDKEFVNQRKANDANKLTNQELIERANRLQLESNYKQKMAQARGRGEGMAKRILKDAAGTALKGAATAAMIYAGKQLLAKIFDAEPGWKGTGKNGQDDLKKKYSELMSGFKTGGGK